MSVPLFDRAFVGQIVQLLEQEQTDHAPDRQTGPALVLIKRAERRLKLRAVDPARQLTQRLAGIEHRRQIGRQELQLRYEIGTGFHRRSLPEIRPS